jgi:hypothetical protein
LHYKLVEQCSEKDREGWVNHFETSLRRFNYLNFNTVFEDMQSESLEMSSFALGPFPKKENIEKFEISLLI